MKITLPVEKLREFLDRAKFVTTDKNDVMNIFNSVKIEIEWGICTLTKSNHQMFCQLSFPVKCDDVILMMEHGNLELFCDTSDRELCLISKPKPGKVMLSDGKYKLTVVDSEYKVEEFPSHTPPTGNGERIEANTIKWLKIARNYIAKDTLRPALCAAYLRGHEMFAANGAIIFYHSFSDKMPNVGLSEVEANIVCSLPFAEYTHSDSFNIYRSGSIVYGFRKMDGTDGFPVEQFTAGITRQNYTVIQRKDVVRFCDSSIKFNKSEIPPLATMIADGTVLTMSFQDNERGGEENVVTTDCQTHGEGFRISFPPQVWKMIMDNLPYEEICISEESNLIGVWSNEDPQYLGMIGKYVQPSEAKMQAEANSYA